jgi:hypothetical protein
MHHKKTSLALKYGSIYQTLPNLYTLLAQNSIVTVHNWKQTAQPSQEGNKLFILGPFGMGVLHLIQINHQPDAI